MSTHTQGKLIAGEVCMVSGWVDIFTIEPNGYTSLPFISCKHHDPEANARRLVAAWNACDGVPTDALEQIEGFGKAALPYHELKAQRDELLKALKALTHSLDEHDLLHDDQRDAFAASIEAIARAEVKP